MKNLLSAIKDKSVDEIIEDDDLRKNAWFFSAKKWEVENWIDVLYDFKTEIKRIKAWSSKPTLYKRFLQRYANVVK
jgi:hypothetical protein